MERLGAYWRGLRNKAIVQIHLTKTETHYASPFLIMLSLYKAADSGFVKKLDLALRVGPLLRLWNRSQTDRRKADVHDRRIFKAVHGHDKNAPALRPDRTAHTGLYKRGDRLSLL